MVESVERFKEERVPEKLWEAEGRSREDTEVGKEDSTAIAWQVSFLQTPFSSSTTYYLIDYRFKSQPKLLYARPE